MSASFDLIPLQNLLACSTNPRATMNPAKLAELAESISAHGVLQPLLVRPRGNRKFEVVCGHRRLVAARAAGLAEVPAVVRELDDREVLEVQVIENLQRADLHELEEADGYGRLHETFGYDVETIAAKVGKSKAYVYARMKLRDLPGKARYLFLAGKLTASTALLVARIPDAKVAAEAAERIATGGGERVQTRDGSWKWQSGPMKYRDAVTWVQRECMAQLSSFPFPLDDAKLLASAGACTSCPKRTGAQRELFDDVAETDDRCLDLKCHDAKRAAWGQRQLADAKKSGAAVLPPEEAKEYFANPWGSKYARVEDSRYDITGNKSIEKALGKDLPPVVLAVDPKTQKLERLVEVAAVKKIAKKLGVGPASKSKKKTPAESEREKRAEFWERVDARVAAAVVAAAEASDLEAGHWFHLARAAERRLGFPRRRGFGRNEKSIRGALTKMSAGQLRGLIVEMLLPGCDRWNEKQPVPDDLREMAAAFGVDVGVHEVAEADASGWSPRAPKPKPATKAAKKKPAAKSKAAAKKSAPKKSPAKKSKTA